MEEFRDQFLKSNDQIKYQELNARKSNEQRVKPYHEIVCDKYNDESWVPVTKLFPLFHQEVSQSFELSLQSRKVLTYKQMKRFLVDVKG